MRRRKGYSLPIISKVYQWNGKKMIPLAQYRTDRGLRNKLSLYAQVMSEAEIYVWMKSWGWHKVVFNQLRHEDGSLVEFGWELIESKEVEKHA